MIGADALVPPTSSQVPPVPKVSYTATPVLGPATAETSLLARRAHWVATPACQDGLASTAEQPEPVPLQTVSAQPRVVAALVSEVPPTAVTNREAAGYSTPKPLSPAEAVTATPGWLKNWVSKVVSEADSGPP